MPFPHEFDRYRVMGFLLRQAREAVREPSTSSSKSGKLTQQALADAVSKNSRLGGISQPSISNLEGLESLDRLFQEGAKPGSRETLIEIVTLGLRLPQLDIDSLLWLFDHRPMNEDEIEYCRKYDDSSSVKTYLNGELRGHVLNLLDRWLVKRNAKLVRPVKARMVMEWDDSARLELREDLLKMEKKPGHRMVFGKYPSILTCPDSSIASTSSTGDASLSEESRRKLQDVMNKRRQAFISNVELFGERCIHAKHLVSHYLSREFRHRLNWEQRREQIENLISLLKRYDLFNVALADTSPNNEVVIKSTEAACLRSADRDTDLPGEKSMLCGPAYVFWYDVTTVFLFYKQFERAWDSIPEKLRDKSFVIQFFKDALDAAR
jgi:hypothetical protein